jgi:ribonuclease E
MDRPAAPPVPPPEEELPHAEAEEIGNTREEISEQPVEGGWEARADVEEFEEDFAPRPMPRDRDRDRGERRDRGDRGGRGGRRDRDRRGGRPGGRRNGGGRDSGRDGNDRPKPLIQDIFKRGQEVIVQVIKEHLGTKGPTLSTYISIPGRYLVLMPGLNRVGVSRKIADEEQRRRLKDIFNELKPPRGVGFIIRTAGEDKTKKELQNDLAYLSRLWQVVVRRIRKQKSPAEIYQESDMITRHIRDTFTGDIDAIVIDEPQAFEQAQEFLQIVMPKYADRIQLYDGTEPLFHRYGIEKEIEKIHQKKVPLPNGGSIVIEQTEALVAIDVNSGNFRADRNDAEETAFQINLQAAREIARQLRLRDLAGVIVNDFIDMRDERRRKGVEKALRDAVKRDRSRIKVLRMSAFGIIEMTRQRVRTSLKRSVFTECPHCNGTGHVKTPESMSLEVIRMVQLAACRDHVRRVDVTVTEAVANYLHNRKRKELTDLEQKGKMTVLITGQPGAAPETLHLICYDNNNNEVKLFAVEERRPPRR